MMNQGLMFGTLLAAAYVLGVASGWIALRYIQGYGMIDENTAKSSK